MRDYSDLGEWRARIGPVYDRLTRRDPAEVVQRHLDAAMSLDRIAMAADYALDAVLERGAGRYVGYTAIAHYFDTVPARLGTSVLTFEDVEISRRSVMVAWRIHDAGVTIASGHDDYVVEHGRITHQVVTLDGSDF